MLLKSTRTLRPSSQALRRATKGPDFTHPVVVTHVRLCETETPDLKLAWSLPVATALQSQCHQKGVHERFQASVTGHTTPACQDVGRGSLRLRFLDASAVTDGGYIVGIRRPGLRWLPAIAGVPGARGLDRYGESRMGLSELLVMARPIAGGEDVTCLPHEVLEGLFPLGLTAEVVVLSRVTDFFLGLNANRWLKIRMRQIADGAIGIVQSEAQGETERLQEFWADTGLQVGQLVEPPPSDASHLFEYWGAGGNTGLSGQVTLE